MDGGRIEKVFGARMATDSVFCNTSWTGHYDADCTSCWLGHHHTWARHYQNLACLAVRRQFGERWLWTCEKELAMSQFERKWWSKNVPFGWKEEYRQTPYWR